MNDEVCICSSFCMCEDRRIALYVIYKFYLLLDRNVSTKKKITQ